MVDGGTFSSHKAKAGHKIIVRENGKKKGGCQRPTKTFDRNIYLATR